MKNIIKMGYNNVDKLYNFKVISNENEGKEIYQYGHFCIFSRVMKEKGIEDAISVINEINNHSNKKIYLDIYGPIDKKYEEDFHALINKQSNYIKYKGNVKPERSFNYLAKYYMLLFPTKYIKEGLPGTLIDAYNAGVPIIASNWKSANEFIKDNETGFIYEFDNIKELKEKIEYAMEHKDDVEHMRKECKIFSHKFEPKEAIKPLLIKLD